MLMEIISKLTDRKKIQTINQESNQLQLYTKKQIERGNKLKDEGKGK